MSAETTLIDRLRGYRPHHDCFCSDGRAEEAAEAIARLAVKLCEAWASLDVAQSENAKLREALGFARSVIKSGEKWTTACDDIIGEALQK